MRSRAGLPVLLLAAGLACGDGPTGPSGPRIEVAGFLERGGAIALTLVNGRDTIPPADITWQIFPASSGTLTSDSGTGLPLLVPSTTGNLSVIAEAMGSTVSRTLPIAAPPSVLFALLRNGNRDIWRVALDGGDSLRLTTDPADDRQPTASAAQVLFVSSRAAGSGLYAVPPGGGAETPFLLSPAGITDPALSADGARLAFAALVGGVPKVWVARGNGGGARRLAPTFGFDGAIEGWPAWSPGADRLALMSTDPGAASLFAIDSAGTSPLPLVDTLTSFQPSWSPTGDSIVFAGSPDGTHTGLFLVMPGGPTVVGLTARGDGDDSRPVWLPDGRIVYLASVTGGAELRWLLPSAPARYHTIPLPAGEPSSPAYLPPP